MSMTLTTKQYLWSALAGALGALIMFIIMQLGLFSGMAPFHVPPSAALLNKWGIPAKPLALVIHFGYGAFWSIILLLIYKSEVSIGKGIGLAIGLWLLMMLVHSPLIGWGVFGTADTSALPVALQLGSTMKFIMITLLLHLIYGAVIGWGNRQWVVNTE
jgi:hypothetical protein